MYAKKMFILNFYLSVGNKFIVYRYSLITKRKDVLRKNIERKKMIQLKFIIYSLTTKRKDELRKKCTVARCKKKTVNPCESFVTQKM
jgi:hypothetical protein